MARRAKTAAADAAEPGTVPTGESTPDPTDTDRLPDDATSFDPASFDGPSFAQRERVRRPDIRTHVEDVILPTVIALEEEKRGRIELSETSRKRIAEAAGMAC